jgi:hypothetical protein
MADSFKAFAVERIGGKGPNGASSLWRIVTDSENSIMLSGGLSLMMNS